MSCEYIAGEPGRPRNVIILFLLVIFGLIHFSNKISWFGEFNSVSNQKTELKYSRSSKIFILFQYIKRNLPQKINNVLIFVLNMALE